MKATPLDIKPSLPAVRHRILGAHHVDAPVAGIEVLMHRFVALKQWKLRSASNGFWRLYWPCSAGGVVIKDGIRHLLDPGFLYLILPHTRFDSDCDKAFAKWYLHFTVGGLPDACRSGVFAFRPAAALRAAVERACPNPGRRPEVMRGPDSSLDAVELILHTLRYVLPRLRSHTNSDARLTRAAAYLREHMRDKVTLAGLSQHCGTSSRTLSQMFVRELGLPPMRYLIEVRLNHAIKLLRHTDCTIEQIAEQCGFPNRYYFTRMLSKYRRVTPAALRACAKS